MDQEANEQTGGLTNRRRLLQGLGAAGAGSVLLAGPASARGGNGQANGGNGRGGGPRERCSCPEGTFLAKYDFVVDDEECYFVLAEGQDVIEISDWESKEGERCEPLTIYYDAPGYEIEGICAFGGRDTHVDDDPDGVFESDLTNPGGQQAAISNVTFCGRPAEDVACPELMARYECTEYELEAGNYRRTGTRLRVTNAGDRKVTYDLAVANEPGDWRDDLEIDAEADQGRIADASVPTAGLVFWACSGDRPAGSQTWGEYKDENGFANLTNWYVNTGSTQSAPQDAPPDVDDDLLVVEVTGIPNGEPDEDIDADDFPDMSQEAEDNGWIACEKFDNND